MSKLHLNEGEVFVEGRSNAKAQELIERAEALGLPGSVVSTTSFGYIVPKEVLEAAEKAADEDATDAADADTAAADAEEAKDEAPADSEEAVTQFDPNEATVAEVKEYLAGADEEERERVLAAERAGQARKGLIADTSEEK